MREDDHDIEPPIDQLCERIVARHHAYLRRTLPIIVADLAHLEDGDGAAGPLAETRAAVADLVQQLKSHLSKEENVLFPALVALAQAEREGSSRPTLPFPTVLYPIRMMETEHGRIEATMARLRALTRDFVPQHDSSAAWRHCLTQLSQLDQVGGLDGGHQCLERAGSDRDVDDVLRALRAGGGTNQQRDQGLRFREWRSRVFVAASWLASFSGPA